MSIERILEEGIQTYGEDYLEKLEKFMVSGIDFGEDFDIEELGNNGKTFNTI